MDHSSDDYCRSFAARMPQGSLALESSRNPPRQNLLRGVQLPCLADRLPLDHVGEKHNVGILVLDRPNPINGVTTEGPPLDPSYNSFVGMHPIPVRHGKTIAELAQQFRDEAVPGSRLSILPMKNWERAMWFDQTGLPWVMPSPNMPTLDTATVYPGMCLLEGTNISEGRGTTR